ncbi:hypothetical protein EJB05_11261, partial [Eragrostis curvula]
MLGTGPSPGVSTIMAASPSLSRLGNSFTAGSSFVLKKGAACGEGSLPLTRPQCHIQPASKASGVAGIRDAVEAVVDVPCPATSSLCRRLPRAARDSQSSTIMLPTVHELEWIGGGVEGGNRRRHLLLPQDVSSSIVEDIPIRESCCQRWSSTTGIQHQVLLLALSWFFDSLFQAWSELLVSELTVDENLATPILIAQKTSTVRSNLVLVDGFLIHVFLTPTISSMMMQAIYFPTSLIGQNFGACCLLLSVVGLMLSV